MPRLALLILTLALGLVSPAQATDVTLSTRSASFGDTDPIDFGRRGPQAHPVHGIDVSRFQGRIDWRAARAAGVNFAFIKATEGGDLLDTAFKENWRGAAKAGVLRGAYHFYYFCTKPAKQADWYIKNVPRGQGALPPVLDMEWNPHSPTCTKRPPPAEVRAAMKIFLDRLERHYGQRPIVYTTPEFYRQNGLSRLKGEEFWLRSVAQPLDKVYPDQRWSFWQYSGTGIVEGIAGKVDLNAFAGTRQAWSNWVARRRQ